MKKFQSVRGMKDILPAQSKAFRSLENILISCVHQYGYEEIRTPILEETDLFIKSIVPSLLSPSIIICSISL